MPNYTYEEMLRDAAAECDRLRQQVDVLQRAAARCVACAESATLRAENERLRRCLAGTLPPGEPPPLVGAEPVRCFVCQQRDAESSALRAELDRAHAAHAELVDEEAKLRARVWLLEAALRELDTWAELYLTPRNGMGADLPRSDWPMLAPSTASWLRRFVERVLKAGRDEG